MLEVTGVSKSFGGLKAVAELSLQVERGRIVSLIGPNGAGKTTAFSLISGFLKPDQGRIRFEHRDIAGFRPHAICRLGLVRTFQVVQPFATLSVLDNITVGAHTRIRQRKPAAARAREVAELVGMGAMLDQPAGALTVAGRKRLELARALATQPKLLLLDEVMAGLNATEIADIVAVVRDIRDTGITILLIEHVMQAVMSLSDDTHVLSHGRIIAHGPPEAVARDPQVIEAYLGHGAAKRIARTRGADRA